MILELAIDGLDVPELTPEEITTRALADDCPACSEALDLFCHFLGITAGNLALTCGAGVVYIAGGIIPKLGKAFETSRFREGFESKGRFRSYMQKIPTFVITHPYPALEGLKLA